MGFQGRIGRFKVIMWEDWSDLYKSVTEKDYPYTIGFSAIGVYFEYTAEREVYSIHIGIMGFNVSFELMDGHKNGQKYKDWVECDV